MTTVVDSQDIGVLSKAFLVLEMFGPTRRTLSLSEISRRSGLPKTTTHRVLQQMLAVGAIDRVGDNYHVGTRMFALSSPSRESVIREVALPHLHELSRRYGHTLHLATLCDNDVLYLAKLQCRASADSPSAVGTRLPAHCTAAGKALLAYQPSPETLTRLYEKPLDWRTTVSITSPDRLAKALMSIRELGFATDHEEAAVGLRCVAVPVKIADSAVAAISIAYAATLELPKDRLLALQDSAARIARRLTHVPGYPQILGIR